MVSELRFEPTPTFVDQKLQIAGEIVADMAGTQYFSKLDASSGYWQIMLDELS